MDTVSIDVAHAVVVALAVFCLPGLTVALAAGARIPASVAASVPATFGLAGFFSWTLGAMGMRFSWLSFTICCLITVALACGWRALFAYRRKTSLRRALFPPERWRERGIADPAWVLPFAGVVAGSWLAIAKMVRFQESVPNGWGNITQGWDVQWHANAIRFVMDTGVASSTRMGELQNPETKIELFYPAAYHAMGGLYAQAAGLTPVQALNVLSVFLPGVLIPAAAAALAWSVLRGKGLTAQIAAGLAPIAAYTLPAVLWVGDYVGFRPYLVAIALACVVVAVFIEAPRDPQISFALAFCFLGVLSVHPAAVTVVVVAVVLYWLTSTLIRPDDSRLRDTLWMGLPAIVGAVLYLPQVLAGSGQAEEVQNWEVKERRPLEDAFDTALHMNTRHVAEFFETFDPTILLWLGAFGLLVGLFLKGQIWPIAFYAVSLAAVVHVYAPFEGTWGEFVNAIASLHYNAAHRLIIPVALMVVAAAAVGVAAIIRVFTLAPVAARVGNRATVWPTTAAAVAVAVLVGWSMTGWAQDTSDEGAEKAFTSSREEQRVIGPDHLAAFDWLASRPEAYEGWTAGEAANGYSWLYAYAGVPTAARHYGWPMGGLGTDESVLTNHADVLGAGKRGEPGATNPVDQAAEDINVKFILSSGMAFWFFQTPNEHVHKAMWATQGVTPVFQKGAVTIFVVNEQFSEDQIRDLQRDAEENGSDPLPTFEQVTPPPTEPSAQVPTWGF